MATGRLGICDEFWGENDEFPEDFMFETHRVLLQKLSI